MRDVRSDVRGFERRVRGQLTLHRDVPLLYVTGPERAVDREHALAEASIRRRRDRCNRRTVLQHERRIDRVKRSLRDGLQERKRRCGERRRDPGHLDPDHAVAGAQHRLVGQAIDAAHARPEIVFLERAHGVRAGILKLVRL